MKTTPSTAAAAPPRVQWMAAIHASSRKNVRWMRTAVPPTSNNLIDQPMGNSPGLGTMKNQIVA